MMKEHRRSRLRMLSGAAALAVLAGAGGLTAATSVAAQADTAKQQDTTRERRVERVIIRDRRDGGERSTSTDRSGSEPANVERREERRVTVIANSDDGHGAASIDLGGPDGSLISAHECGGPQGSFDISEGEADNRTRIIICSNSSDPSPARQTAALERARAHLAENSEIDPERLQRVLAALDRRIAQLRAQ